MKSLGSFETSTNTHSLTELQNPIILENLEKASAIVQAVRIACQFYKHFSEK